MFLFELIYYFDIRFQFMTKIIFPSVRKRLRTKK
jgi:hypothetical protein